MKEGENFREMLLNQRENIKMRLAPASKVDGPIDMKWQGTRMEVELPQTATSSSVKKNIVPEMVNQRFMWVDDYFHYSDWENKAKEVYDSFNLLPLPRKEGEFKYFYNRGTNQRIVPQGIFPPPNNKRTVLMPQAHTLTEPVKGSDVMNLFEKDPYNIMMNKEIVRSSKLAELKPEMSFITNLQNMKQGLKQDYSDKQIMDLLLVNLSLTDNLIAQHLNKLS